MKHIALAFSLTLALAACDSRQPADQTAAPAATPAAAASAPTTNASAADAPATAPAANPLDLAGFAGYGDLKFGISEEAFRQGWGELKGGQRAPGSSCTTMWPVSAGTPPSIRFMFENDKFVRYDVATAKETAPGGGKSGMSLDALMKRYPGAQTSPDKYDPAASTVRVQGQGDAALIFEIGKDGKVSRWRVGVAPQIDYVESCG